MDWLCINLYYQQYQQNYVLNKINDFLKQQRLKDVLFFYQLGFDDIFFIRLTFKCKEEEKISISQLVEEFRKNNKILKSYKSKKVDYIKEPMRYGGIEFIDIIEKLYMNSSKAALRLMFYENNIDSYFNLLFSTVVFNYMTVRSFLNPVNSKIFFELYTRVTEQPGYDAQFDSRFDTVAVKSAIESIDLKGILLLAEENALDICDELNTFVKVNKEAKKELLHLKSGLKSNISELVIYPEQINKKPFFRILLGLVDLNNNRMGILDSHSSFTATMIANAMNP